MPKPTAPIDVLVLGQHPAAYFVAALLKSNSNLRIVLAATPDPACADRLVTLNPAFFSLHPALTPLKRKLKLSGTYGLQFLGEDPAQRGEYRTKAASAYVASLKDVRTHFVTLAKKAGVEIVTPKVLQIRRIDETGMDVQLNKTLHRATMLVLAGPIDTPQRKLLGLSPSWDEHVVHRYTYARLKAGKSFDAGGRPPIEMSLDLHGKLCWGWLLRHGAEVQIAVEQPIETVATLPPSQLLQTWAKILSKHGVTHNGHVPSLNSAVSVDLPLAGALAHEGVANRALLVGPAGGFYSACGEDLYPNCWSAVFAAETIRTALKERHLQDALQSYRHTWRTTLGDYLRGPHQNLRFLLPLVYRNPVMTARMAEAILTSKSVVR